MQYQVVSFLETWNSKYKFKYYHKHVQYKYVDYTYFMYENQTMNFSCCRSYRIILYKTNVHGNESVKDMVQLYIIYYIKHIRDYNTLLRPRIRPLLPTCMVNVTFCRTVVAKLCITDRICSISAIKSLCSLPTGLYVISLCYGVVGPS